jgi:EAL and modified HD-GYP domain-containing signal transduction protein
VSEDAQIFIGRQPILDRYEHIVAYELLYRDSAESETAVFSDHRCAASRIMANTFATMGADAILGPYSGFINVDRATLVAGLAEVLPRERVTLELLEDIEPDAEVRDACRRLVDKGFCLALDDFVEGDPREALLELVSFVKVDVIAVPDRRLPQLVRRLRDLPVTLLAEKVETREEYDRCRGLGFECFQGFYFARPVVISGTGLDPARSMLLRLLQQIRDQADTEVLCETIKRHASLGLNVLRLVNSTAVARSQKVSTVRDAVVLMGRGHLERWLNLLLFAGEDPTGLSSPLLQTAAKRGRLMELLLRKSQWRDAPAIAEDRAFLVGMTSLLDALLGRPLPEIVRELNLDDEIRVAVLERGGPLGRLLQLAERLDELDFSAVAELVSDAGISPGQMTRAELEAFQWVQELGHAASPGRDPTNDAGSG